MHPAALIVLLSGCCVLLLSVAKHPVHACAFHVPSCLLVTTGCCAHTALVFLTMCRPTLGGTTQHYCKGTVFAVWHLYGAVIGICAAPSSALLHLVHSTATYNLQPPPQATVGIMEPRDIAAVVWALAASDGCGGGDGADDLAAACAGVAARGAHLFAPSQLAQVVWALGALHASPGHGGMYGMLGAAEPVAGAVARALRHGFDAFGWEDVAAVMWGLTALGHHDPKLVRHVNMAAAARLQQHKPPAEAKGKSQSSSSKKAASPGSSSKTKSQGTAQPAASLPKAAHLVQLLHSLAVLGESDPTLHAAAAPCVTAGLDDLDTEALVQAIWAYACALPPRLQCTPTFAYGSAALAPRHRLEPCDHARQPRLKNSNQQATAVPKQPGSSKAAQGTAAAGACAAVLRAAGEMLSEAVPAARSQDLTVQELRMLWQAHHRAAAWAEAHAGGAASSPFVLPPQLLEEGTS